MGEIVSCLYSTVKVIEIFKSKKLMIIDFPKPAFFFNLEMNVLANVKRSCSAGYISSNLILLVFLSWMHKFSES